MTSEAEDALGEGAPRKRVRRAVYVTRIDTDGDEGKIVMGEDYSVASPKVLETTGGGEDPAPGGDATERWLKENVPPHW